MELFQVWALLFTYSGHSATSSTEKQNMEFHFLTKKVSKHRWRNLSVFFCEQIKLQGTKGNKIRNYSSFKSTLNYSIILTMFLFLRLQTKEGERQ